MKNLSKIPIFLTLFFFIFNQIVWPIENFLSNYLNTYSNHDILTQKNNKTLENLAHIQISEDFNKKNKKIIIIEDSHASISAQYSIINILQYLIDKHNINLINIEGGTKGYIDTSILASFPKQEIKEKIATILLKQNKISAGEFLSIMKNNVLLYGTENQKLYKKNYDYFKKIIKESNKKLQILEKLIKILEEKEKNIYTEKLYSLIFKSRLYKKGEIDLDVYLNLLIDFVNTKNIQLKTTKNIDQWFNISKIEKEIDFTTAKKEYELLVKELSNKLNKKNISNLLKKSLDFQDKKINQTSYYNWLIKLAKENGINLVNYINFIKYFEYIISYENIDIIELNNEIEKIEQEILTSSFISKKQKNIYDLIHFLNIIKQLFQIKISSKDYQYLKKYVNETNINSLIKQIISYTKKTLPKKTLFSLFKETKNNLNFYKLANNRNKIILKNTLYTMQKENQNISILITGGFHSKELINLIKNKNLPYMLLTPKFTEGEKRPYKDLITNEKQTILHHIGDYTLAFKAFFDKTNPSNYKEAIAFIANQYTTTEEFKKIIPYWLHSFSIWHLSNNSNNYTQQQTHFINLLKSVDIKYSKKNQKIIVIDNKEYVFDNTNIVSKSKNSSIPLLKYICFLFNKFYLYIIKLIEQYFPNNIIYPHKNIGALIFIKYSSPIYMKDLNEELSKQSFKNIKIIQLKEKNTKKEIKFYEKQFNPYGHIILDFNEVDQIKTIENVLLQIIGHINVLDFLKHPETVDLNIENIDKIHYSFLQIKQTLAHPYHRYIESINLYSKKRLFENKNFFFFHSKKENIPTSEPLKQKINILNNTMQKQKTIQIISFNINNVTELQALAQEHRTYIAKYAKKQNKKNFPINIHVRLKIKNITKKNLKQFLHLANVYDVITENQITLNISKNSIKTIENFIKNQYGQTFKPEISICYDSRSLINNIKSWENRIYRNYKPLKNYAKFWEEYTGEIKINGFFTLKNGISIQGYPAIIEYLANNNKIPDTTPPTIKSFYEKSNEIIIEPIHPIDLEQNKNEYTLYEKILIQA